MSEAGVGERARTPGPLALSVAVVLAALAARAAINFANITPGGMDAGYYPIQARSLIESGDLLYRDVPLYHWAVAGVARCLMGLGASLDSGVLAASKALDTVWPLGLGLAVLVMGLAFAQRRLSGPALAAPVALAVLSAPAVRMVSDFQKQAAAMALFAGAVCLCHRALARGRAGTPVWAGVAALLVLTGLTHAGTFAAAGLTVACIVAVYAGVFARLSPVKLAALTLLAALGAAALFAGVYVADEGKAMGLVRGVSKLTRLSISGGGALPGPGHDAGPRPGPGMLGGFGAMGLAIALAAHAVGLWTLVVARWSQDAPAADRAAAVGCSIAAMALASPLLAPDYFMRLTLMAPVPLAIAVAFVLAQRTRHGRSALAAWVILAISGLSAAAPLSFLLRPMVTEAGITELRAMAPIVHEKRGTVVVARHGLEFWAAYFLNAPVRTAPGKAADLAKFGRVLVLAEVNERMGPGRRGGPGGPMGPGRGLPMRRDRGPGGPPGTADTMPLLGPPLYGGGDFTLAERAPPDAR